MRNSIGLVEFKNISRGIESADGMLKGAGVELLQATPVCPGKFVVIVGGELSSVRSAVDHAKAVHGDSIIDSFVIGNVAEQVFPALTGTVDIKNKNALGMIETFTVAAAIEAGDLAVKAAVVDLVEIRIARGMGGKCFALLTGGISDVTAAVEAGSQKAQEQGTLVNRVVIPNPHVDLWDKLV